jgi:hypothetical protein
VITLHQVLLVAAVVFVGIGATAGLSIWLTRDLFYQRGHNEGWDDGYVEGRLDAERIAVEVAHQRLPGGEGGVSAALREGRGIAAGPSRFFDAPYCLPRRAQPAEVYDHETEGL